MAQISRHHRAMAQMGPTAARAPPLAAQRGLARRGTRPAFHCGRFHREEVRVHSANGQGPSSMRAQPASLPFGANVASASSVGESFLRLGQDDRP
jgi:hypothetical protein